MRLFPPALPFTPRWCRLTLLIVAAGLVCAETADSAFDEGVAAYFAGKPVPAVAAFDRVIALAPVAAPRLWQRGLAQYYAGDFAGGRKQFELHQTVNPRDVENAAWHFLCVARLEGVAAARAALIPIAGDSRIPMTEVHALFAGTGTDAAVLAAASQATDAQARRDQLCFAHLYLGLWYEALGQTDQAKAHMLSAANEQRTDHYMGRTAQLHARLRGWVAPE